MSITYLREIILACAFTSVSIHLLNQRRDAQAERLRYTAQVGALEDVVQRLRAGEVVSDEELGKIHRRVGLLKRDSTLAKPKLMEWKEILAKKEPLKEMTDEQVLAEWNRAVREASEEDGRQPSLLQALFGGQTATETSGANDNHAVTRLEAPNQTLDQSQRNAQTSKKPLFY